MCGALIGIVAAARRRVSLRKWRNRHHRRSSSGIGIAWRIALIALAAAAAAQCIGSALGGS